MTEEEKASFLSLVGRFLAWRKASMKIFAEFEDTFHSPGFRKMGRYVYLTYIYGRNVLPWKICSGRDLGDCVRNSLSYMNVLTDTSGREDLEMFLESNGF